MYIQFGMDVFVSQQQTLLVTLGFFDDLRNYLFDLICSMKMFATSLKQGSLYPQKVKSIQQYNLSLL